MYRVLTVVVSDALQQLLPLVACEMLSSVQMDAALLTNNSQRCWVLHIASVCTPCFMLLRVVGSCCGSLKLVERLSQKLPTVCSFFFRDRRGVARQYWIRLHSSSNIVGATHVDYIWSPWRWQCINMLIIIIIIIGLFNIISSSNTSIENQLTYKQR